MVTRAIETDLIQRAGLTRTSLARTRVVTLIQRFGSAPAYVGRPAHPRPEAVMARFPGDRHI